MPPQIFAVDWDVLDLEHVQSFLQAATEEGLTWEAKAGERPHNRSVHKAVCGFANSTVGGFLILGAEHAEGQGWSLPGMNFQGEAGPWISSVIATGMSPVPRFDVKVWPRDGGRIACVIAVDPVAVPPCITKQGQVFERTSGQTIPVTDPLVLTRLTDRGQAARERAALTATASVASLVNYPPADLPVLLSLGLAATGMPDDVSAYLFNEDFATGAFLTQIREHLQLGPYLRRPFFTAVEQGALKATLEGLDSIWVATARWDGSVAIGYLAPETQLVATGLMELIRPAWVVAANLLRELSAYGSAHLYCSAQLWNEGVQFKRWTSVEPPTEAELSSVERELRRANGEPAWET